MSIFKKILSSFLLLSLLVLSYGTWSFHKTGSFTEEKEIDIPKGSTVIKVAEILKEQGVIDDPLAFIGATVLLGKFSKLKAGEYAFTPHSSMSEVLEKIVKGKLLKRFITIPEGWRVDEAVERLNKTPTLTGEITLLPPEGSILPDTYEYKKGESRLSVLSRMQFAMTNFLVGIEKAQKDLPYPLTLHEIVVLASVVEKETGKASERSHIASVFYNRLLAGMPLQSDPTVIYALKAAGTPLNRPLLRSDLKVPSPFNTYYQKGLPPSPIACPSKEAILAVINPLTTNDLYFVADGTGGHVFTQNLQDHNKAVKKWYDLRKKTSER